jgi:V/A-type H+-transporting ATPase subunit C
MKKPSYHQINPLIRLKEAELLTATQFQQLLMADSVADVIELLKNTGYQPYLKADFVTAFDAVTSRTQGQLFRWLYEFAPEPDVVSLYTLRFTFHNLKVLTKAEVTGTNLDHLFVEDGRYGIQTLKSAVRTQNSSEVPQALLTAIREVFAYLEAGGFVQAIDVLYDRAFLTQQRQLAEALAYPQLVKEVVAFIDLTNIAIAGRGLVQKQHKNFLSTMLSSSGSLSKKELLYYAEGSLADFTTFVLSTVYGSVLKELVSAETNELNLVQFEKVKDDYLTTLYENSHTEAFGPLPLLAFLNAKEIEAKNLRILLVGKSTGLATADIKERMRKVYGL